MNLSNYIGETTEYDKKELLEERKPKSWLKTISAFANGIGGTLIFGISNDNSLVGLANAKDTSEKISEIMKTKLDPLPEINMEIHNEGGKDFIILKIQPGMETPYYYIGDGNRIAFVRVGNESIPADAIALKRLVIKGSNITFDSLSTKYNFNDFSFTKLKSVYYQRTKSKLSETDFTSFGLVDEYGMLTNAGALLADESPMRHSRLFCTRWYGTNKASGIMEALDDKEVSGSLITLLQAGEEFIKNNTKKRWKKTSTGRIEMPEYPERAVLECIVNGLIHRDYLILGSEVHIDIYDNRIEITSPGGMFDGSTVQNLNTDHITSKRRNPIIADLFSRMNYMERRGSGFKKIKDDYRHAVNYRPEVEPQFYSDISTFEVTLFNLNYNVPIEKVLIKDKKVAFDDEKVAFNTQKVAFDDEKVAFENYLSNTSTTTPTKQKALSLFYNYGYDHAFSRANVIEMFHLAPSSAGKFINRLKLLGIIEIVKGHGNGKYKFIVPTK